jgi:hypothetical protein
MTIYISYSQKDKASFTSIKLALEGKGVKCWDPASMQAGSSLREQLLRGMQACDLCVFVATKNSLDSKWCSAELGAFWGARKRVIIFTADSDVSEDRLPPQFGDDLRTNDVNDVVRAVKSEIDERQNERDKGKRLFQSRLVANLTISDLFDMLDWMRSSPREISLRDVMIRLREIWGRSSGHRTEAEIAGIEAAAAPLLTLLVGAPWVILQSLAIREWPHQFSLKTDTGNWYGYAVFARSLTQVDAYENCLLVYQGASACDGAILLSDVWEHESQGIGVGTIVLRAGTHELGKPQEIQ